MLIGRSPPKLFHQSTPRQHRTRRNTSKYCWSHAACAHWGTECTNKKPGHIDDATFTNRKGGSTDFVRIV